ncbi:putative zinc-resistance associated protein [Megalodesulfovibrio gigas]|uniref:Putative zinc-resistance associated protein n=1 Tax=Megalodesulfovibrio gigas (strain ATCC 19364 / DSM 1382 / NCIMB 9332 / VKM B-1759) TaxID=1121448 RepID=T2GAJ0_MEGG1|nr:putative zinc-resistance associated protein [Megalodesulfovibrio gigas]AGW12937.1 putative zinc-resistance associated protein [Megalodesulfovibrio gigas DSM 1382 = ATCC 19364]
MKSRLSIFAMLLLLGLAFAMPALAMQHRGGHGQGSGCGMMAGNATDPEALAKFKQFQDETTALRRSLAADATELEAVLSAQNPDTAKARLLREKIFDTHQKLRDAAEKAGIAGGMGGCGGMMGGGCGGGGCGGMGKGCM